MAMNKCTGEIFNCPALHPGKLPNRTCRGKNPRVLVMWNLISSWKRWCDATNCNSRVLGQIQDFLTVPSPPVPIQDRMQIRQTSSLPPSPPFVWDQLKWVLKDLKGDVKSITAEVATVGWLGSGTGHELGEKHLVFDGSKKGKGLVWALTLPPKCKHKSLPVEPCWFVAFGEAEDMERRPAVTPGHSCILPHPPETILPFPTVPGAAVAAFPASLGCQSQHLRPCPVLDQPQVSLLC